MPINEVKKNGKVIGYKWGKSGKVYLKSKYGCKKAREMAAKQAQAAYASGYKKEKQNV